MPTNRPGPTEVTRCELCGERFRPDDHPEAGQGSDELAEMYDPTNPVAASVICHAQCGLNKNLAIA